MKKQTVRALALLLAMTCLVGLLAGCGAQQQQTTSGDTPATEAAKTPAVETQKPVVESGASITVQEDTLIVAIEVEGSTFDPFGYADLNDAYLVRACHEPLAYLDSTAESGFTPVLLESWEYPDNNTIRLHLRKNVLFQNGEEMKASDVLFSLVMSKEIGLLNPSNWENLDLENANIVDDYTLEIKTFEPSSFSFTWLLSEMVSIVSEKAYTEAGDSYGRNPNGGTGPYILTDWVAGSSVTFTRNENYWGVKPQYKTAILRFIVDGTARTFAVESGDVDVAYSCSPSDLEVLSSLENYEVIRHPISGVNYLFFNCQDKYLKDVRVRKALTYALDLQTMVPIAFSNMGTVAYSVFGPAAQQQVRPDTVYDKQDMEKAKALMAEAGFADGFDLKFVVVDRAPRKIMAEMIKNAWASLNVNLEIEVLELSTILEMIKNNEYQLTIMAEGGFHGEAWRSYLHTNGGNNYSKYSNPRVDELFDLSVQTVDQEQSMVYYTELQNIFAEDIPMLPLQYDEKVNVVRKGMYFAMDPRYNFMYTRFSYIRYD